ncbi:MAG: beta-propeller fold lactonase family protein [Leucobacter sp.]
MRALIGSYTIPSPWTGTPHAHGAGISVLAIGEGGGSRDSDGAAGTGAAPAARSLALDGAARPELNPSFLVLGEDGRSVWAVTEPEHGGELLRFELSPDGRLADAPPARIETGADAPCHVALGPGVALVSHYHGGAVSVVVRDDADRPARVAELIRTPTTGEGWDRADAVSRPHSALFLPGTDCFAVADYGRDLVLLYRWDRGAAATALVQAVPLPEGTGPRHLAWRGPGERGERAELLLVSNQEGGGVTVLGIERGERGIALVHKQTAPGPGLGRERPVPSEIAVHPDGEHAVLANRFDDSLTVYGIDAAGSLTERVTVDSDGRNPRHFAFAPDGSMLVVAHQDSDELVAFAWRDGAPADPVALEAATPTAVLFVPER